MLQLTAWLAGKLDIGFHVDGFMTAVGGAIVITIVTWGVNYAARPVMPALPTPHAAGRYRVALVCLGNICRSPMAHVVLESRLDDAGLGDRVEVDQQRHRRLARRQPDGPPGGGDADRGGVRRHPAPRPAVRRRRRPTARPGAGHGPRQPGPTWAASPPSVRLFRDFDPVGTGGDVPDPYYGGDAGFEEVLTMVERTSASLVDLLAETSAHRAR